MLMAVLVGVILLLQRSLWLSDASIPALVKLRAQLYQQQQNNQQLDVRNKKLYVRIQDLKNSNQVIEGVARSQLGLIQKGETFYHLIPANKVPDLPLSESTAS